MDSEESRNNESTEEYMKVEKFCHSYLNSKQVSADECFIHDMMKHIKDDIYIDVGKEHCDKSFVNRFSTKTGGKCKDGQLEVRCK